MNRADKPSRERITPIDGVIATVQQPNSLGFRTDVGRDKRYYTVESSNSRLQPARYGVSDTDAR